MTDKKKTPRDYNRKNKRAEESRDLWKDKHHQVQYDLKKARAINDALKKSRDGWHVSYSNASKEIQELKENLELIRKENQLLREESKRLRELEIQKKKSNRR